MADCTDCINAPTTTVKTARVMTFTRRLKKFALLPQWKQTPRRGGGRGIALTTPTGSLDAHGPGRYDHSVASVDQHNKYFNTSVMRALPEASEAAMLLLERAIFTK